MSKKSKSRELALVARLHVLKLFLYVHVHVHVPCPMAIRVCLQCCHRNSPLMSEAPHYWISLYICFTLPL